MGITRQYLRWSQRSLFGCIASQNADIVYLNNAKYGSIDRVVATGQCERVAIWDTKTGEQVMILSDDNCKSEVTALVTNANTALLASGHADGTIRLYDIDSRQLKVTFSGHKSPVTTLCFDTNGLRLASGGKDTEIVVWDVTNESGLYRLKGHKGVVTKLQFMTNHSVLVSASKDTYIKFWDLTTQHCFKTLVGHRSEVWSFVIYNSDRRLISGASDSELKVWNIVHKSDNLDEFCTKLEDLKIKTNTSNEDIDDDIEEEVNEESDLLIIERLGTIMRKSTQKLTNLFVDSSERLLICHSKEAIIECFKLRSEEEMKKSINRRIKKANKRRIKSTANDLSGNEEVEQDSVDKEINVKTLSDEIEKLEFIHTNGAKVKSCDVVLVKNEFKVAALLTDNSIELFSFRPLSEPQMYGCLRLQGHRTDIRSVSISSDNFSLATVSSDSVKIWNKSSTKCITTISDGVEYGLCSVFAPGDRYVIVGTKTGRLQMYDINAAQLINTIDASEDLLPIWSICLIPNAQGLVSGSEDKLVKFWTFELQLDTVSNTRSLIVGYKRTLKMDEGVLCVRVSPNGKFVAISLLDSTVKLYFYDTLKFFLSLYGHKFPVLSMDISSDSSLIATGSSDKNIKIWGMDFGDCHKSIFAHDDNIMCVQFVPKTHYLFTVSKDKTLKEWDADNFEKIITLTGHQAEVWALAVSLNGKFAVTASHDKSIRIWEKSSEPLVLEEEQEIEREKQFEDSLFAHEETVIAGETNKETALPSKKTIETVKGAEKLIEALDVFRTEIEILKEYELECNVCVKDQKPLPMRPQPNPNMMYYKTDCPYRYILEVLKRIKSNELEETLLTLPFNYIIELLQVLVQLCARKWEVELLGRCICFILRVNFGQIVSTPTLLPTLDQLRHHMKSSVTDLKDIVGVNTASLHYYHSILESNEEVSLFKEAFDKQSLRKKRRTKSHTTSAPIMAWN
ncbi:WD repeat-containing protein 3-like [Oppia nitens]|uniref:WD repeat-containing protein 3-like n=1 Tax=Oppia nitens TaxID=1686743 RepID=UPI0023D9AD5A|nr:WD repeat-containing protein 3-like [Oppia nitens]